MELLSLGFLAQVLRISVPYVLAALGGTFCERSGVINIALEGLLLCGAFAAAAGSLLLGPALGPVAGPLAGLLVGVAAGVAMAALYGLVVLRLRADQIVVGVAITLLASGLTRFLLKALYDSSSNSPRLAGFAVPSWASAGGVRGFFAETVVSPLVLTTVLAVVLSHVALQHTRLGLRLRAAGEHPEALRSVGIDPAGLRWTGVLLSGALGGLGGVFLAYDQHKFVANMSAGRGYIALAAMIVGGWRPLPATAACVLFGFAEALQLRLQSTALGGSGLVQVLPHLVTVAVLAARTRRRLAPGALGRPL